jgi:deoxyhypusine synthase
VERLKHHLVKKAKLAAGTKYAILTTEAAPQPDKKTGRMPTEEERAKWQRVDQVAWDCRRPFSFSWSSGNSS